MSDLDNILFDLAYQQGKSVSECLYDVYNKGRADGYSQAENDYFAQSQKDREDTYNCGYAIGRAEVISEVESIMKKYATYENVDVFVEVLRELKKE